MSQEITDSITQALSDSLSATADLLPKLLIAILIFIVGVAVASILRSALVRILGALNFEKALETTGVPQALKKAESKLTVSALLGELLRWFVILIFLIPAVDQLGLGAVNDVLKSMLLYIPNVVVAVIIVAIGAIFARISRDFVTATAAGLSADLSTIVGEGARWAIIIFSLLAALNQLGVATDLIRILFTGFVAALAISSGLAFGLGGKDAAEKILNKFLERVSKD